MPEPTNIPNIPNNAEIDKALKEFEAKKAEQNQKAPEASSASPIPAPSKEVSGVKFETDSYRAVKYYNETEAPKVVKWVMKISGGAVKDQKQAEYVLFGFVVVAIAVSLYLFFGGGRATKQQKFINTTKPTQMMLEPGR